MNFKRTLCRSVLVFLSVAAATSAHAGAFEIRSQSAQGFGTALAGVAAGGALSYSYWNPATLADVDKFQFESVANGVFPSIHLSPNTPPGDTIGIGKNALVPAAYAAMPLNDRVTIGLSITSPFGLATKTPQDWVGQIYARESQIMAFNANPMISYRVNNMLSFGVGLQVQYFKAKLTQAIGPAPGDDSAELKADGFGVGFNLGMQLRPWTGGTIGIGYRSAIKQDLDGHLAAGGVSTPATANLTTPSVASLGFRQELDARTRALGTVEWTNWSHISTIPVYEENSGVVLTNLPLRYRDGWLFSLGGEYDWSNKITVRGGVGYEIAPVNDETRDIRLPEPNQLILSGGFSYRYSEQTTFDFAITHSIGLGDGPVTIGSTDPRYLGLPFAATSDLHVTIVSASIRMKFDKPPW